MNVATEGPYIFTQSEGLTHIRLRARPKDCVACIRTDAYMIVVEETRRAALAEALEAAQKIAKGEGR